MLRFVLQRLAQSVPTLLLVSVTVFLLMRMIPGDPASLMLGDQAKPEQVEALRRALGLDKGPVEQFFAWFGRLLQGDLGHSIANGRPVLPLIVDRLQVTASVVLIAIVLAAIIGVGGGMLAAWRQNRGLDLAIVGISTLLLSIPSFWAGLLLLLFFGLELGWLPIVGYVSFAEDWRAAALYLILPIATLVLTDSGAITRMARASTIEVMRLEYITHARAKGLSEGAVLWRHAFKNAFAPTWTLIGWMLGNLLAGIAVVETVFTLPGLGRLLVDSIYARDYPVVQGCLLVIAGIYVLVNLLVDLLYPLFDPRVTA